MEEALKFLFQAKESIRFLNNISDDELRAILTDARIENYQTGERVFTKGEEGETIYVILSGEVNITAETDKVLATLRTNDIFGEMSLITGLRRSATAIATHDSTTLLAFTINREIQPGLEKVYAHLYQNFARILSRKLQIQNTTIIDMQDFDDGFDF